MVSIRELTKCIGVTSDDVSVLGHFFGFSRASLPAGASVSVLTQIDRLAMPHFHVNIVRIGSDNFSTADKDDLDFAIIRLRDIYANHGFGVGRVMNWGVKTADALGLDIVTKKRELRQITQNWTIDNDGIDVFVPRIMNIARGPGFVGGLSPVGGTCDNKDKTTGLSGSVIDMTGSQCGTGTTGVGISHTGRTMAHELGHYLGLFHKNHKPRNLMCQTGKTKNSCIATALTDHQKKNVRNHCAMKPGC